MARYYQTKDGKTVTREEWEEYQTTVRDRIRSHIPTKTSTTSKKDEEEEEKKKQEAEKKKLEQEKAREERLSKQTVEIPTKEDIQQTVKQTQTPSFANLQEIQDYASNNDKTSITQTLQQAIDERDSLRATINDKIKATGRNNDVLEVYTGNYSRQPGMLTYESKENKQFQNIQEDETKNQQEIRNLEKTLKNDPDYQRYVDITERTLPSLEYAERIKKANEGEQSFLSKAFSPLMSGVDNVLFTKNRYVDEDGTQMYLPSLNDLKTERAMEEGGGAYDFYAGATQSIGNLASSAVASAVATPAVGLAVMGGQTYASARNDAVMQGYEGKDAEKYAVINAGLEVTLGKLLGGMSSVVGKSVASKGISNTLSKGVTSKIMSNSVVNGMVSDAFSEFGEEYIQEWIDPKVRAYILDNKSLVESWESSDFLSKENFIAGLQGAVVSGVFNGTSALANKGTTSDTTEDISPIKVSEETMQQVKDIENQALNEYNGLIEPTGIEEIGDTAVNSILDRETTDNVKINNFRTSATENNVQVDNETANAIEKIIGDKDIDVEFSYDFGEGQNGKIETLEDGSTKITLNPNTTRKAEFVVMHELTHAIETDVMKQMVNDYASKQPQFNEALNSLKKTYNTEDVSSEVLADVSGQLFGNQEFINNLSTEKPNTFKKIYDAIISLANKITGNKNENLFIKDLKNKWESAYRTQNNQIEGSKLSKQENKNKVVNEDGSAKTVYHGSNTDFEVFDKSKLGSTSESIDSKLGFHFTDNKGFAENYGNVKDYNLELNNPLEIKADKKTAEDIYYALTGTKEFTHDYLETPLEVVEEVIQEGTIAQFKDELASTEGAVERLKELGYDGLILPIQPSDVQTLKELGKDTNGVEYVVFEPTQIKNVNNKETTTQTKGNQIKISEKGKKALEELSQNPYADVKKIKKPNIELLNDEIIVYRRINKGEKLKDKPQGLYVTPIYTDYVYTAFEDYGDNDLFLKTKIGNMLVLNDEKTSSSRGENIEHSAGTKTLDLLDKNLYENIKYKDLETAKKIVKEKFPNIKNIDRNSDINDLMEKVGGFLAKKEGYDSIYIGNENNPILNEIVLLNDNFKVVESEIKDNQGNTLSKQQQEYFKDSKIRDENGNLEVVYHGIPNDFTEFNYDYIGSNGTALGKGFYFANSKDFAEGYVGDNGNVMEVYLDINKPLSQNEITLTKKDLTKYITELHKKDVDNSLLWDFGDISTESISSVVEKATTSLLEYNDNDVDIINEIGNINGGQWLNDFTTLKEQLGYDGIVQKNEGTNVYIPFLPNQIKNTNNNNPTTDKDIRYSQQSGKWQEFLESNFKSSGTTTEFNTQKTIVPIKKQKNVAPVKKEIAPIKEKVISNEVINNVKEATAKKQEQVSAQLLETRPLKEQKGLKDNLKKTYQKIVDRGSYVAELSQKTGNKELYAKYDQIENSRGIADYNIGIAQTNNKGEKIGKSIIDIWTPIEKSGKDFDFSMYLLHKHNVDRSREGKPVFGEEITSEISQEAVSQYEKDNPEFLEYSKEINTYNKNQLQNMVDAGLTSQEMANTLNEMYSNYVRIYRDVQGSSPVTISNGNIKVNSPIKKAKGGNQNILPLKDAMAQQTYEVEKAIKNNIFGEELYKVLGGTETEVEDGSERVSMDKDGNYSFTYYEDGKPIKIEIDEKLYESIKPKKTYDWEDILPLKASRKLLQFQRGIITDKNPLFLVSNFFKDLGDAPFNSKHASKFFPNFARAYQEIATGGEYYELYKSLGGSTQSYFDYDNGVKMPSNKPLNKFVQKISAVNTVVETAPRLAEFISSIEAGDSIDVAMYNAAEVTTNFKRGGEITKAMNRNFSNFLNASVQGFDKQIRNISGQNGAKGYANLLLKATLLGVVPSMINDMLLDDDEDYQALPDYIKDGYYLFKTGDNQFIRIPKGRVVGTFGNIARRTNEYFEGDSTAYEGMGESIKNNIAPSNPFTSNVLSPFMQVATNTSWAGSDIVPTRLQDLPVAEQYDEKTDEISKFIGETFNISPKKVNYLLDQYGGVFADFILPMSTPQAELNPIESKFTTNSVTSNKYSQEFYDVKEELATKSNSSEATAEDRLKTKYFNAKQTELNALYTKKREIQTSSLSDEVKLKQVEEVQQQINDISKSALEEYENIQNYNNYSVVDGIYFEKEIKDGEVDWAKMSDSDYTKMEQSLEKFGGTEDDYFANKEMYSYANQYTANYDILEAVGGYEKTKGYKELIDEGRKNTEEKKEYTFATIESLPNLSDIQKAMLFKSYYSSFKNYDTAIENYVYSLNIPDNRKEDMLKSLGMRD